MVLIIVEANNVNDRYCQASRAATALSNILVGGDRMDPRGVSDEQVQWSLSIYALAAHLLHSCQRDRAADKLLTVPNGEMKSLSDLIEARASKRKFTQRLAPRPFRYWCDIASVHG